MGQCLRELAAGLPQLAREPTRWRNAAAASISKARERVGPGVMRQILEHLAGPLGSQADLWRGRRVCAVDRECGLLRRTEVLAVPAAAAAGAG